MAYSSRLVFGVNPATGPYGPMRPGSAEWGGVRVDLNRARATNANLLLVGPEHLVVNLVSFLVPNLKPGDTIRCQDGQLPLPPASAPAGTVVIRDVDALTPEQQRRLLDWLDSAPSGTQVVSTASAPLLPLVETGAFNDTLYYRLNTVYIDVSSPHFS